MEINLSSEMIYKVTCVAFGRLHELKEKEIEVKLNIADIVKDNNIPINERELSRKRILLKDIEKAKEDAKEVHALFIELLEQLENK